MTIDFGNLTLSVLERDLEGNSLDFLFKNSSKTLEEMNVIEKEQQIALENLKKLTIELQTKRLRYNAKSSCKYFTL